MYCVIVVVIIEKQSSNPGDLIPGHETNLDEFQKIEITQNMFSDSNKIKLKTIHRKVSVIFTTIRN